MDCIVLGVAKIQTQLSDFHVELYCEYLYFTMIDQASVVKVIEVSGQETDPHVKKMQCLCLFLVRLEFMNPSIGRDLMRSFAWEIPWTEEPGKLQSKGLQKSQT